MVCDDVLPVAAAILPAAMFVFVTTENYLFDWNVKLFNWIFLVNRNVLFILKISLLN